MEHQYADALYAVNQGFVPIEMMRGAMTAKIHLGVTMIGVKDPKSFSDFVFNRNYAGEQFPRWKPRNLQKEPVYNFIGAPHDFYQVDWEGTM